jgi:hypothetical protein
MSVAKGRRQFVIVDRPGGPGWQTGGLAGNIVETAAFSYRVDSRQTFPYGFMEVLRVTAYHLPGDYRSRCTN